jgi:hypothetical protein
VFQNLLFYTKKLQHQRISANSVALWTDFEHIPILLCHLDVQLARF